jgi:hypothetical protein
MVVDISIGATTGFQRGGYDKIELVTIFQHTLKLTGKTLRVYKKKKKKCKRYIYFYGGNVTIKFKDQSFSLFYL